LREDLGECFVEYKLNLESISKTRFGLFVLHPHGKLILTNDKGVVIDCKRMLAMEMIEIGSHSMFPSFCALVLENNSMENNLVNSSRMEATHSEISSKEKCLPILVKGKWESQNFDLHPSLLN
jgi:hypothetical protein